MSGRRSLPAAVATCLIALGLVAAPAAAATPQPVGRWTLEDNTGNTGTSSAQLLKAAAPQGAFVDVAYGSGTRKVWYTGDSGNGGLVFFLLPEAARSTYTLELRVRTTNVTAFNHLVGFGAGDDGSGAGYDPGRNEYPDCGLYFRSARLRFRCGADYVTPSGTGVRANRWMTVRITRQEKATGADKLAIFVNGRCLGAFNDRAGFGRFVSGAGVLGRDNTTETAPTWFAGVTIWSKAILPKACPIG